jgi:hypothetical protein
MSGIRVILVNRDQRATPAAIAVETGVMTDKDSQGISCRQ